MFTHNDCTYGGHLPRALVLSNVINSGTNRKHKLQVAKFEVFTVMIFLEDGGS
jgi:hypothetical protein